MRDSWNGNRLENGSRLEETAQVSTGDHRDEPETRHSTVVSCIKTGSDGGAHSTMVGADRGELRTKAHKVSGSHRCLHIERLEGMVFSGGGGLQRFPSAITVAHFQQTGGYRTISKTGHIGCCT